MFCFWFFLARFISCVLHYVIIGSLSQQICLVFHEVVTEYTVIKSSLLHCSAVLETELFCGYVLAVRYLAGYCYCSGQVLPASSLKNSFIVELIHETFKYVISVH